MSLGWWETAGETAGARVVGGVSGGAASMLPDCASRARQQVPYKGLGFAKGELRAVLARLRRRFDLREASAEELLCQALQKARRAARQNR